jgi:hypothetical protein
LTISNAGSTTVTSNPSSGHGSFFEGDDRDFLEEVATYQMAPMTPLN